MSSRCFIATTAVLGAAILILELDSEAMGQEVWSGRTLFFEKADFADWTLEGNEDRITDNVWITRQNTRGIFNIAQESSYTNDLSPADTEWATGDAVDWASLTFQTWEQWHGSNPPGSVGVDAVVHLITDDIYIDIRFESWTSGGLGGGFSYYRAPDVTPVEYGTWSVIKAFYQ